MSLYKIDLEMLKSWLFEILSEKRYRHTLGVMESAEYLSMLYGADSRKALLAALFHDCAKEMKGTEIVALCKEDGFLPDEIMLMYPDKLLHSFAGSVIAKNRFGINDAEILDAIRYHTTGRPDLTLLDKIIFMADYIEPNRILEGLEELRLLTYANLDLSMIKGLDLSIQYILEKKSLIHPMTVEARNYLVKKYIYNV